jgi:predicted GNAT family acetyltransferase
MELRKFIATTIREYLNEEKLFENSKLNKLLDFELDEVKIDDGYAHAELSIEQLSDGEISIYISEIWSDIKGKGYATKLLNKINRNIK